MMETWRRRREERIGGNSDRRLGLASQPKQSITSTFRYYFSILFYTYTCKLWSIDLFFFLFLSSLLSFHISPRSLQIQLVQSSGESEANDILRHVLPTSSPILILFYAKGTSHTFSMAAICTSKSGIILRSAYISFCGPSRISIHPSCLIMSNRI